MENCRARIGFGKCSWQLEWVLIIDADERIAPELEREIGGHLPHRRGQIISTAGSGFCGWMDKSLGIFPSWNLRLFRHGRLADMNKLKSATMLVEVPRTPRARIAEWLRRISTDTNGALRLSGHCSVY